MYECYVSYNTHRDGYYMSIISSNLGLLLLYLYTDCTILYANAA